MTLLLLWIAKLIQYLVRKIGHGGAALPGLVVEKFSKNFLSVYLNKIPQGVIVVSGTNGKTTTTKILVEVLEKLNQRVFTNRTGSNMTRGLISAIISHATIMGRMPYDIAVLEVDEAYGSKFSDSIPVKGVVILNVMRDQLDRFGEIDMTADLLSALTIKASGFVVLNSADERVKKMPSLPGVKRVMFGLASELKKEIISDDDWHRNQHEKQTDKADYLLLKSKNNTCSIKIKNDDFSLNNKITGIHNHLNLLAAIACLNELVLSNNISKLIELVQSIEPAFGRGEKITVGSCSLTLQLIKNPGSFMQNIKSINLNKYNRITILINDSYADSRDVSWLWDVDFSIFKNLHRSILLGGTRAYDLAVRLKHDGVQFDHIDTNIASLTEKMVNDEGDNLVFCTYTAMLNIRKILVKKGHTGKIV